MLIDEKDIYEKVFDSLITKKIYFDCLNKTEGFHSLSNDDVKLRLIKKVSLTDKFLGKGIYRVGDFILIKFEDDQTNQSYNAVAKTLAITEVTCKTNSITKFYFTVQHLTEIKVKQTKTKNIASYSFYKELTYEANNFQNIDIESLNGPAFVIPCFKDQNKCFYIERKFFDRSGWIDSEIITNTNIETCYHHDDEHTMIVTDATTDEMINNYFTSNKKKKDEEDKEHQDEEEEDEDEDEEGEDEIEEDEEEDPFLIL